MSKPGSSNAAEDVARTDNVLTGLLSQGLKFGLVGVVATGTHVSIFVLCIEFAGMRPLWANLPAFGVAVLVGFAGHFSWTFRGRDAARRGRVSGPLARFVATSLLGLLLNSLIVYAVVDALGLPYGYAAALMATAVPAAIFAISKYWAFA